MQPADMVNSLENGKLMYPEISEAERFPRISPEGRRYLHRLREHPNAPIWRWPAGEQLDDRGLERVHQYANKLRFPSPNMEEGLPSWIADHVDYCLAEVPFYRRRNGPGTRFDSISSCSRQDLVRAVWDFVPDDQSVEQLIIFYSSGTTGHPAKLPTHPFTAACGVPLIENALSRFEIAFPRGVDRMALTNVAAFPEAYTNAIVISYLDEAGCVRINIREEDWRHREDRAKYIDSLNAPVILTDPIALDQLQHLELTSKPKAIVSSITELNPKFAAELNARYQCPIIDLYAITEVGILAMRTEFGHEILAPDVHVEILDENDQVVPAGTRGEVTLTGGRNPFAPLLRYRTGDFASFEFRHGKRYLVGLEGRTPVMFGGSNGQWVHSMEIARKLRGLSLVQYSLHQETEKEYRFQFLGGASEEELLETLHAILGADSKIVMEKLTSQSMRGRKLRQFTSQVFSATKTMLVTG